MNNERKIESEVITKALDANGEKLGDIVANCFKKYEEWVLRVQTGKDLETKQSEILPRCISQAVIEAFQLGYLSGIDTSFDILEARIDKQEHL